MNKNKIIKIVALGVAAILLMVGGVVALIQANKKDNPIETQALEYRLSADKTYYIVYGIGESTNPELVIPSTYQNLPVKEIANYAFKDCDSLTSINVGANVTKIGLEAFSDCNNVVSISLNKNLQYIGSYAFQNCAALTNITIPMGVSYLGGSIFYECTALKSIAVSENNVNYKSLDGNLYTKDGTKLIQYAPGKTETSFTTPAGVNKIDAYAFSYSKLTSVTISEGVNSIVFYAFANCENLQQVIISKSVKNISKGAFSDCKALTSIRFTGTCSEWSEVKRGEDWVKGVLAQEVVCEDGVLAI